MIFPWFENLRQFFSGADRQRHHALLLHGPEGIGKSDLGAALAQAWLCEAPDARGVGCGRCAACQWLRDGNHPDLQILRPESRDGAAAADGAGEAEAKQTGAVQAPADREARARRTRASNDIRIDQVRALEAFVNTSAHQSGCKIVLIDPADALNRPAANALLKTLEEPSGETRFILVSAHPDRLPATIRSRCLCVGLALPDPDLALAWLADASGGDRVLAGRWLAAAGGAPLRAREFADPAAASAHRMLVETFASLPDTSLMQAADRLAGVETSRWNTTLLCWIVDLQRCLAGAGPRFFPEQAAALRAQARRTTLRQLVFLARDIAKSGQYVDRSLNPRLMAEDALIGMYSALQNRQAPMRRTEMHGS